MHQQGHAIAMPNQWQQPWAPAPMGYIIPTGAPMPCPFIYYPAQAGTAIPVMPHEQPRRTDATGHARQSRALAPTGQMQGAGPNSDAENTQQSDLDSARSAASREWQDAAAPADTTQNANRRSSRMTLRDQRRVWCHKLAKEVNLTFQQACKKRDFRRFPTD